MIVFNKNYIISSYFEASMVDSSKKIELLPFGHSRHFPLKFGLVDKQICAGELNFFNTVFYKNFTDNNFVNPDKCKIEQNKVTDKLIILNCLDNCFGHALLKLFYAVNYIQNQDKSFDFLLILPKALSHFNKKKAGVNCLIIDYSFSQLQECFVLNNEIDKIAGQYNEVFIESVETYDSFDKAVLIDNLNLLNKDSLVNSVKDKIIFYYRSDYFRMWNGKSQLKNCVALFSFLKKFVDDRIQFYVVGDLDKQQFPSWITDERIAKFNKDVDFKYNQLFDTSLICIGLTGSHMLFPSLFSECTVHLHPAHKYKNMTEDTVVKINTNEMFSAYQHLYYFGNYNCSDLKPEQLGRLILFHYQGLVEKKYKLFVRENVSQKDWINKNYSFLNLGEINAYRQQFNAKEAKKNRVKYYLDKIFG